MGSVLLTQQRAAQTAVNKAAAEAMLVSASILRLGASKAVAHGIDDDSRDRIVSSLKVGKFCSIMLLRVVKY